MKKTKIISTIGPASNSFTTLLQLIQAGMDIARFNFSHGTHKEHAKHISALRHANKIAQKSIAIMLDTKGPEIRTMKLRAGKAVFLQANAKFTLTGKQNIIGDEQRVAVTYSDIVNDVVVGSHILIDDGLIELIVEKIDIDKQELYCRVLNSGTLGEYKGVNIPNISSHLPALSEKDKKDLIFACQQKVDFIAASFIRKPSDIEDIRTYLDEHGGEHISIIAKIENQEGIDNFDDILAIADGIMVARGDLGVEIPIEEVILTQKMMINKSNSSAKPIIVATQMLESMTTNLRPTRAEAGDVANAILDGADAVMLSGETAKGLYPAEAVRIMNEICRKTDPYVFYSESLDKLFSIIDSVSYSIAQIANRLSSPIIAVMTELGEEAKFVRKYFPQATILAVTSNDWIFRQLLLVRGVYPYLIAKPIDTVDSFIKQCRDIAIKNQLANLNDIIIVMFNNNTKNNCLITSVLS